MQCFSLPTKTTNNINKIIRNFIWGSTLSKKKIHYVSCSSIIKPKNQGDLHFRDAKYHNQVFLSSLSWRFLTYDCFIFWKSLLINKYAHSPTIDPFIIPSKSKKWIFHLVEHSYWLESLSSIHKMGCRFWQGHKILEG